MKKLLLLILLLIPISVNAITVPEVYSSSVLVYDATIDEMVMEKNIDQVKDIASLTKVLTVITAINNSSDLNKKVKITNDIINSVPAGASNAGLIPGHEVTLMDLLYGAILPSGADATHAIAYSVGGNLKNFAKMMNAEAKKAGATNSNFVNPSGMTDKGHQSTARDQLKILMYALKNEIFRKVYSSSYHKMSDGLDTYGQLPKYKALVTNTEVNVIGLKTGYTKPAGYCLSLYFKYLDHDFYLITLGALPHQGPGYLNMKDASTLMNKVVAHYKKFNLAKENTIIDSIKVEDSKINKYDIKIGDSISYFLPDDVDKSKITYKYEGVESIDDKNNVGDFLGAVSVYYKDIELDSVNIYLDKQIMSDNVVSVINNTAIAFLKVVVVILSSIIVVLVIITYLLTKYNSTKVQSITLEQLSFLQRRLIENNGLIHGYQRGKKVNFKILELDSQNMKVTLKKLK